MVCAIFLVSFLCVFRSVLCTVDSSSLLWPIPEQLTTLDSDVRALDPDKFEFMTDINSALLNQAFQRYRGILFKTPTPFYPDGAPMDVKTLMPMLTVKVTNGDETLNADTDESCESVIMEERLALSHVIREG